LTWQDELRQLDVELASGRITADEYRTRRDRVTAAAANPSGAAQAEAPQQTANNPSSQPVESTQLIAPVTGGQARPPRTAPPPQHGGDADRTQAVNPAWGAQDPGDAERTQAVPRSGFPQGGRPPASPAGGFPLPQYEQPGGWQGEEQLPPQWSGAELPASAPWATSGFDSGFDSGRGDPWGAKQGPEVFEDSGPKTGKIVAIVAAVVLLAGLGVGAYFLWGQDSGGGGQAQQPPVATKPPAPTKKPNPMKIADLPGQQQDTNIKDFAGVLGIGYLTPEESSAYQDAQPGKAAVVVSQLENGGRVIVMVVQVSSANAANKAVTELAQLQIGFGAAKVSNPPTNVQATKTADTIRAHYASGDQVVRIEVQGRNQSATTASFNSVIESQLNNLPADG
jgi:hypothetical protein